jgi:hypothetical protein
MTLEDLQQQGVLLPEEEWGEHALTSTVPRLTVLGLLTVEVAGIVMAYLADGGALTFVGIGAFIAALFTLTWVLDRSIVRLRRRERRERGRSHRAGDGRDAESSARHADE